MSVNSYAESLSSNLVLSEIEKQSIRTSLSALRSRLNAYFDNIEEMFEFGSLDSLNNGQIAGGFAC